MNKKRLIIILCSVLITVILIIFGLQFFGEKQGMVSVIAGDNNTVTDNNFDYKIIHKVNNESNSNYLVSPLSIGYALSMLNEGADGITKEEIDKLLSNYQLLKINNVKDRIGIANALFINDFYKKKIDKNYKDTLTEKYDAELIFDDFSSPKNVNNWISKKTFKMIPRALEQLDSDDVLVLVNTIAINLEWEHEFKKENTHKQVFNKIDGSSIYSAMMSASNKVNYIKSDKAQGIVKSYKSYDDSSNLEYIAILPDGDIKEYVNNFDEEEFKKLFDSRRYANGESLTVNYNLPKYTYDFGLYLKKDLIELGMGSAFDERANLSKISKEMHLLVDDVIHKTHVEVAEEGTKAAAVTAITFKNTAVSHDEKEIINIDFDRPFVYIIKDVKYDNIWFFGVVYEPMKWEDNK